MTRSIGRRADVLAAYPIWVAVLTLPYGVVVTLLDREEGIWSP